MKPSNLFPVLMLAVACHRSQPAQGPFERAGKGLDNAAEKTGDALKTAAEKTGEAAKKATHATGKAVRKVGQKIEGNGSENDDGAAGASSKPAP